MVRPNCMTVMDGFFILSGKKGEEDGFRWRIFAGDSK